MIMDYNAFYWFNSTYYHSLREVKKGLLREYGGKIPDDVILWLSYNCGKSLAHLEDGKLRKVL